MKKSSFGTTKSLTYLLLEYIKVLKTLNNMKYDIAIIGGGPAGYTAAERAAAGGLKTVIFEKKAMGVFV